MSRLAFTVATASVLLATAFPAAATTVTVTESASEGSTTDLFNGANVGATSPILSGFTAKDAFGSVTKGTVYEEAIKGGTVIFADQPESSVNFIKFSTAGLVSLSGINAFVAQDGPSSARSFSSIKFFGSNDGGETYGVNLGSSGVLNYGETGSILASFAFDTPFVGQYFLFEGVNFSNGPRIVEIDAIGAVPEPATWAMMVLGFGLAGGAMRRKRVQLVHA